MENPYTPPTLEEKHRDKAFSVQSVVIFTATLAVVIANYATEISSQMELANLFRHVCFVISPIALVMHSKNLRDSFRKSATTGISWILLILLSVPVSFGVSLLPCLSENQYEGYYPRSLCFGPNGWMQWTWLLVLGILPFALVSKRIRRIRPLTGFNSAAAICGHAHNAFVVFVVCDVSD